MRQILSLLGRCSKLFLAWFGVTTFGYFAPTNAYAQQTIRRIPVDTGPDIPYLEHLPDDYDDNDRHYPLLIFLHGTGEQGDGSDKKAQKVAQHGPPRYIREGHDMTFKVDGQSYSFIVISPQLLYNHGSWPNDYLEPVLQHVLQHYRVDTSRIYLTGLSLGGGGTWRFGAEHVNTFAAIAPVCAAQSVDIRLARRIARINLPVWAFHGGDDRTVPVDKTRGWINELSKRGADPKYTEYTGVGHAGAWQRAYQPDHRFHQPNLYEWLLQHQKSHSSTGAKP